VSRTGGGEQTVTVVASRCGADVFTLPKGMVLTIVSACFAQTSARAHQQALEPIVRAHAAIVPNADISVLISCSDLCLDSGLETAAV
jgi:hypothetical protein